MRAKLMTSAAVLAGVLAFATMGHAQSLGGGWGGGETEDSYNDNSDTTDSYNSDTDVDVDVSDSLNDSSQNDNSTNVAITDSFKKYDTDVDVDDSFNDNSDNSTHTDLDLDVDDSFNDNSDHSISNDNSYNTENSFNTDNSTHDWNIRVSLNYQELYASVSDIGFEQSEEDDGRQSARMRTGDITQDGGAFAGFAGIQTVSNNTGMASIGQAATAVSANSNVTFGSGG